MRSAHFASPPRGCDPTGGTQISTRLAPARACRVETRLGVHKSYRADRSSLHKAPWRHSWERATFVLPQPWEDDVSAQFVAALEAEMAALREQLSQDMRFVRLREIERLRELYRERGDDASHGNAPNVARNADAPRPASKPPLRKASPERLQAIGAARMLVANRVGPVPTAEIYDHIAELGIPIRGENPVNNLSAMLSSSGIFKANGRAGWTIRNEDDGADDEGQSPDDVRDARIMRDADDEHEDILGSLPPPPPPPDDDDYEEAPQPQPPPPWRSKSPYG